MASEPVTENERASAEQIAQVHRALAAAQDRYYWLDRWGIDLNALMRKPGASQARAAVSAVRAIVRIAREMSAHNERARAGRPAGPRATDSAGPTYYAEVIVDALGETGIGLREGMRGMDLGGSSDGVARVLSGTFPGLEMSAETSPDQTPLSHGDQSFDFVCAITPGSHFSESSAAGLLRELRRVIRPNGRLVLTSHTEFLTPDWLLERTSPDWAVLLYRPGRILGSEDLYVLEPR